MYAYIFHFLMKTPFFIFIITGLIVIELFNFVLGTGYYAQQEY